MKETLIWKKIKEHLKKEYGGTAHKYHGGPFSENGVSDLFGCVPPHGRAIFLEVKQPGKKADPWQLAFLRDEAKRGAITGVVTSTADVDNILRNAGVYPQLSK